MEIPQGQTPGNRTDIEDLITGIGYPNEIALDLAHGMMYWANTETEEPFYEQKIRRATLNGQDLEDIVTVDGGLPMGIALDVSLGPIPTLSEWTLIVLAVLTVAAGALVLIRRRPVRA